MAKTQMDQMGAAAVDPDAAVWAQEHFASQSIQAVTNHTWAKTYRLRGPSGNAYLKVVPKSDPSRNRAIAGIARAFAPRVPALLAAETDRGFFVYDSHDGSDFEGRLSPSDKAALLALYGELQGKALSDPDLLANLPSKSCIQLLDEMQNLLHEAATGAPDPQRSGNPFLYMRSSSVRKYASVFQAADGMLRAFLAEGEALTPTLNHCDLRAKNIARRDDGSLCIFDWDDAVQGPPGLSLHAQFSGCTRVYAALQGRESGQDGSALGAYVDALVTHGGYDPADLRVALPATAAAGVLNYIQSFAAYPVGSDRSRRSIVKSVRRRMSDLMDLMVVIAEGEPKASAALSQAFAATGREARAKALAERMTRQAQADVAQIIRQSDRPEVFPSVQVSDVERQTGALSKQTRDLAETLFKRHGGLMIKDAFTPDQIEAMRRDFDALRAEHDATIEDGGALRVGDKRFMLSLELKGAFADPSVIASPFVLPVLHRLLSKEAILGSFTAVASLPGSKDQSLHRDNPPLFEEHSTLQTPSFCIALIIPLIALDQTTGATRIIKGSHRRRTAEAKTMPVQDPIVDLGACYLMDSRLFHQGMANNSDHIRPILSLVYQRPWYRDHKNFKKQSPLKMTDRQRNSFPKAMRKLVSWAGEPS